MKIKKVILIVLAVIVLAFAGLLVRKFILTPDNPSGRGDVQDAPKFDMPKIEIPKIVTPTLN